MRTRSMAVGCLIVAFAVAFTSGCTDSPLPLEGRDALQGGRGTILVPSEKTLSAEIGVPVELPVVARDAAGRRIPAEQIQWVIDDSSVVEIEDGVVHALKPGSTAITGSAAGVSASLFLNVWGSIIVRGVRIAPDTLTLAPGANQQVRAYVTYSNNRTVSLRASVAWSTAQPSIATVSRGQVRGVAQGATKLVARFAGRVDTSVIVVGARPPAADSTPTPTPTPGPTPPPPTPNPTPNQSWTYCTAAGATCDFTGLRDVRLLAPNGTFVEQTAYHTIPCATYGFGNRNPGPGQSLHCAYGVLKTTVLTNPRPGMGGLGATVTVPMGSPGVSQPQTTPTRYTPTRTPGSGAFRTTCSLAKYAFDDPIVFPGRPGASHLHAFFGNTGVNANSTTESLTGSGNSTCRGGTLNRTAYWVPALYDSRTGEVQVPEEGVFYYKTGYNLDPTVIKPLPAGLRMIAGNSQATGIQPYVEWGCRDHWIDNTGSIPTACPIGDAVRLTVQFPQCWDGVNLDSPDHKSHMAYPNYRNPPQVSTCPPSHPIALPAITEHFDYPVTASSTPASWRLASDMYASSMRGGLSAHADWMIGWDASTLNTFVTQCLNKSLDCQVGSLGDGRDLY